MEKENNKSILSGVILTVVGLAVLIGGVVVYNYLRLSMDEFLKTAIKTEGIISEIIRTRSGSSDRTKHEPFVTFTTKDGMEIKTRLYYYNSGMRVGNPIEIYYDPANPNRIETNPQSTPRIVLLVFCFIGFISSTIGGVTIKQHINSKRGLSIPQS